MKIQEIKKLDIFFEAVGRRLKGALKIYLTGGVAAWAMGGVRPTEDIDFAAPALTREQQSVLEEVSRETGVPINYAQDIERWGMINIPDLVRGARFYDRFGKLSVYLLAPERWAIGKLTRYWNSDVQDILTVFRKNPPKQETTLALWRRALRESPSSQAQVLFRNNVNHFLKQHGREIWGKACPEKLL